ncbi:hypothetical protein EFP18_26865 [Burkholderia glumae]|uniref:Uncharacterized protein n=3 Tax=Burkholderia glumae TaxID=337 RepID=A0AAQ0BPN8_BURGL|nr:Hypothetical protein bglu_2g18710 [Burkholderia glumae BGR1]KHJ59581.1 hypothetical protein NCPPB3923_28610 [Burkholderia glumae]PJO22488.1 hypothetical protein Y5A_013535 [Burkholderia glumae AU6208]NVE25373.1 hypothetical protein [Burkholderia glumae]PNL05535.1 hypothetical protein CEQ24_006460 [Burkholderia glumae]
MSFSMNEKPMSCPRPDAPRRADGIVFHLALGDSWIETVGVPFECRGRVWAVHRSPLVAPDSHPRYTVSDVETGRSFRRVLEPTIEAARAAAIGVIATMPPPVWNKMVRSRDHAQVAA